MSLTELPRKPSLRNLGRLAAEQLLHGMFPSCRKFSLVQKTWVGVDA